MMAYLLLFFQSFLAATLVPFSSEAVLAAMIYNDFNPVYCLVAASAGNWLGGMSSYGLGYLGKLEHIEKWLRINHEKLLRWQEKIQKYGSYLALITWLPFVGDIIAVGLGFFKVRWLPVAVLSLVARVLRYTIITYWMVG
jgi:membrane protein YqaA with SNARE-associated domain